MCFFFATSGQMTLSVVSAGCHCLYDLWKNFYKATLLSREKTNHFQVNCKNTFKILFVDRGKAHLTNIYKYKYIYTQQYSVRIFVSIEAVFTKPKLD